ncbi:MAG: hypothetical protein QOH57_917 [Mycobacterium sp.]|jgi:uncharacterized integral membrane protein|nr:hypothetical protein [Mycobacterium sp.]
MSSDPTVPPPMPEPGPPLAHPEPVHGGAHPPAKQPRSFPPSAVTFTKTAAAWWALIVGALTLILLLVFIGQNLDSTTIHFFGWAWETPTGIALLVAAIGGSLITVMTGGLRMLQLRRAAKKNLRAGLEPPA